MLVQTVASCEFRNCYSNLVKIMKTLYLVLLLSAVSIATPVPHHHYGGGYGGGYVKTGYIGGGGYGDGGGEIYKSGGGGGGVSFSLGGGGGGVGSGYATKTVETHVVHEAPQVIAEKVVDVELESPPPVPQKKTVIERTVIPNYVEKRVQVPTYVEKTIRVPTYVEKTIRVPAEPTIVEKEISHEEAPVQKHAVKVVEHHVETAPVETVHVQHTYQERPYKTVSVTSTGGGGYGGYGGGYGGGYSGGGYSGGYGGGGGGGGGGVSFSAGGGGGGGLFDSIFNIPIKTLGAVNGLVNGVAGGGAIGGGASFSKGYSYY